MKKLSTRHVCMILFVLGLVTRFIGAYKGGSGGDRGDDDGMMLNIALNYLSGQGFMMYWQGLGPLYSFEPPGMPVFHLIFIKLFTNFLFAERVFFVLMSSATASLFFLLAKRYFSDRIALLASLAFVLYPPQWFWSTRINGHAYATNMLVVSLLVLNIAWEKRSTLLGLVVGLFWASMSLMRPEYLPGAFILAAASFLKFRREPLGIKLPIAIVLGWTLLLAPWTIRNYLKIGKFVMSSTHYGYNLWWVFNPQYNYGGLVMPPPPELEARLNAVADSETKLADIWVGEAKQFIKDHPKQAAKHVIVNFLNFWRPWLTFGRVPLFENLLYLVSWSPIFILFLIGLFKIPYWDPRWFVIWTFLLYKTIAQLPFYMIVRFREAVFPLFVLIAFFPVALWLEQRMNPSNSPSKP